MEAAWHERARELHAQGLSISRIAAEVGKARSTVGDIVRVEPMLCACGARRTRQAATCKSCDSATRAVSGEEHLERVASMYDDGMSVREIAAALGWGPNSTPPALTELARRGRITRRQASKEKTLVAIRDSVIDGCDAAGWTAGEIAEAVGMKESGVRDALRWIRRGGGARASYRRTAA